MLADRIGVAAADKIAFTFNTSRNAVLWERGTFARRLDKETASKQQQSADKCGAAALLYSSSLLHDKNTNENTNGKKKGWGLV